jgi:hypothetical protein
LKVIAKGKLVKNNREEVIAVHEIGLFMASSGEAK